MAASLQMVDFKEEYGASVRNSHQSEAITFDDTRSMFKSIEANKDYEVGEIFAQVSFQVFPESVWAQGSSNSGGL